MIKDLFKFYIMQFFVFKKLLCPQKVEKPTLKNWSEKLKSTFFPFLPWTAQMAQTEEFVFQNVAYRPTVKLTPYAIFKATR